MAQEQTFYTMATRLVQSDCSQQTFLCLDSSGVLSVDEIYEFLIQENARDIVVIKLDKSLNYVDYFMVATANSSRHLAVSLEIKLENYMLESYCSM